jgi:hypothetical protein
MTGAETLFVFSTVAVVSTLWTLFAVAWTVAP